MDNDTVYMEHLFTIQSCAIVQITIKKYYFSTGCIDMMKHSHIQSLTFAWVTFLMQYDNQTVTYKSPLQFFEPSNLTRFKELQRRQDADA